MLFFKSTFTISSGSSSALCPVSVTYVWPFSVTIACVTHLRNAKSNTFFSFGIVIVIKDFSSFILQVTSPFEVFSSLSADFWVNLVFSSSKIYFSVLSFADIVKDIVPLYGLYPSGAVSSFMFNTVWVPAFDIVISFLTSM